jgi:hypothetical protein
MAALFFILLVIALAGLIYLVVQLMPLRSEASRLDAELRELKARYDTDINHWKTQAAGQKARWERLSKWEAVADADAKATELHQEAQAALDRAKVEATTIGTEARQRAKTLKDEAEAILDSATTKAARIVADANKKGEEIAASAYDAMRNASLYQRTVSAMRNIIDGYGDLYIIPGRSLLDDLADDFGHTQAGQQLKGSRDHTKLMIRNGTAATCEYVEANRHNTAVNFVIDAFNGKVDSILSRVRYDNAGTLQQEIRDAFTLVNFNGKAFRNARITEEFLAARLDELKWAAIAQQLRLEEREEQGRIKEKIREEEKARREYARAMQDAAKEEDMLRKAMEKAQQQIEMASAEQKARYEQQLQELGDQLRQAQERNQRALSMAQQTKRGHVYIISNVGSFGDDVYKIGLTRRLEPLDRVRELGDSSVPFEFDVHAMIFSEDAPTLETQLHRHFLLNQMNKVNPRKEFFRVDVAHIREEVEKLGLTVHWTMLAEAREYRESRAVEKAVKENAIMREAWLRQQREFERPTEEVLETAEPDEDE